MYGSRSNSAKRCTGRRVASQVGLSALLVVVGISVAAPADAAPAATGYYMAVSGADLQPGRHYKPTEIQDLAQKAGGAVSGGPPGVVQPASVASGYILWNPGYKRSDYVYDSDWGDEVELYCTTTCTVIEKWQTQLHEYVQGGTSKSWILTLNARHVSGGHSAYFDYWYACAINVPNDADHYCSTGHGADPSPESGAMNPGWQLHRYFERNNYSNVEYPMVGIGVHFAHSRTVNQYRGADVCVSAGDARLCKTTGTGKSSPATHTW